MRISTVTGGKAGYKTNIMVVLEQGIILDADPALFD